MKYRVVLAEGHKTMVTHSQPFCRSRGTSETRTSWCERNRLAEQKVHDNGVAPVSALHFLPILSKLSAS